MNWKKTLLYLLAGTTLGVGGGLLVRRSRPDLEATRRRLKKMQALVHLSIERLSQATGKRVSASEAFFFIWVVERVCHRHQLKAPSFNFRVRQGMLASPKLTFVLRRMLSKGSLLLEGDFLLPGAPPVGPEELERFESWPEVVWVVEQTAREWIREVPEEPLVRFSKVFS